MKGSSAPPYIPGAIAVAGDVNCVPVASEGSKAISFLVRICTQYVLGHPLVGVVPAGTVLVEIWVQVVAIERVPHAARRSPEIDCVLIFRRDSHVGVIYAIRWTALIVGAVRRGAIRLVVVRAQRAP